MKIAIYKVEVKMKNIFRKFLKKSLKFQIIFTLIISVIIPMTAFFYNMAANDREETAILKDQTERLKSVSEYVNSVFTESLKSKLENSSNYDERSKILDEAYSSFKRPMLGITVGIHVNSTNENFTIGYPKKIHEAFNTGVNDQSTRNSIDVKKYIDLVNKTGKPITEHVSSGYSSVIINVHPIKIEGKTYGAAWEIEPMAGGLFLYRKTKNYIFAFTIFGLLMGLTLTILILQNLVRNINTLVKGVKSIKTDISYEIQPISGELGQVASSVNSMAKSLMEKEKMEERLRRTEKLAALGQLVSGVAHEIRNPLGIIRASVQVMEREFKDVEGMDEFLKVIKEQSDRENNVICELLDYARPSKPMFLELNVNMIVSSVLTFTKHYIKNKHIDIGLELKDDIENTLIDAEKLKQVFINIIINACDAMENGGKLLIRTGVEGNYVFASFKDTGSGIDEKNIKSIFNPYFTTKSKGTGLGLAISQSIMNAHKGYIKVKSQKGKGAEFIVYIPKVSKEMN